MFDLRADVREAPAEGVRVKYIWVLQSTKPVRDLFSSYPNTYSTRVEAIRALDELAPKMNWKLGED